MKFNKNKSLIILLSCCLLFAFGFDSCETSSNESTRQRQAKERNTESLSKKQPLPDINFSMDRDLLIKRLTRFNNPNKMNYLYIFAGDRILELTIVGKVTSTTKRLTDPQKWDSPDGISGEYDRIDIADEMGTFGSSNGASLAMTTLGSLVEFGGFIGYFYSEVQFEFSGEEKVTKINIQLSEAEKSTLNKELNSLRNAYNKETSK